MTWSPADHDRSHVHGPGARALALVVLSLAALLVLAPLAQAHANLVDAEPPPNKRVHQAPSELRLSFSEPLSDHYTNVEVLDGNGTDHATEIRIDEDARTRLTVELAPLPDGVYSVRWQTLSQTDGHTRSGVYFLAVNASVDGKGPGGGGTAPDGNASVDPGAPGNELGILEPMFRALGFAGASLAVGTPLFLLLCAGQGVPERARSRLWAATVVGAGLAALASLGLLAGLAARTDLSTAAVLATEPGRVLAVRAGLFAGAGLLALPVAVTRWTETQAALAASSTTLGLAGLLATTLGGHASGATSWLALAVVNDWLHQVAVAFWIAGVVGLVILAVGRASEATGAKIVRRFSPLAVVAVIVIVVTGTVSAIDRLPTLSDLWSTAYGWALVAKIALLVPLIGFGAYHRYRVLPDLETPGQRTRDFSRLKRSAGAEVAVMALVLVAAGALTTLAPPSPAAEATAPDQATFEPYHTFNGSGVSVDVYITPLPVRVGFQEMFVNVTVDDEDVNASRLTSFLSLRPPSNPHGEVSPREAHRLANGTFHYGGALITEPGTWQATLLIQGPVFLQEAFEIEVGSS